MAAWSTSSRSRSRELEARCAQQDLEGACYRVTRRLAAEHADEIDRRFPKILRRVGGYNLDEFVPERSRAQDGYSTSTSPVCSSARRERSA